MSQALWLTARGHGPDHGWRLGGGCAGVVAGVVQGLAEPHDLVFELGGHALGTHGGAASAYGSTRLLMSSPISCSGAA